MSPPVNCVRSLCNLINSLQPYPLQLRHFTNLKDPRKSVESAQALWNVLHNLTCDIGCKDVVLCTKLQFAKKNFNGLYLYTLSNDILNTKNSWELLLAFSWLISQHIIEEKIDEIILKLYDFKQNNQIEECELIKRENQERCELINAAGRICNAYIKHRYYESEKSYLQSTIGKVLAERCSINPSLIIRLYHHTQQSESVIGLILHCKDLVDLYAIWKTQERTYLKWITDFLEQKDIRSLKDQLISQEESLNAILFNNRLTEYIARRDGIPGSVLDENDFCHQLRKVIDVLHDFGLAVLK